MPGEKHLSEPERAAIKDALIKLRRDIGATGWDAVARRLNRGLPEEELVSRQTVERAVEGHGGLKVQRALQRLHASTSGTTFQAVRLPGAAAPAALAGGQLYPVVEEELAIAAALEGFTTAHADAVRVRLGRLKGEPSVNEVRAIIKAVIRDVEDRRREYFPPPGSVPPALDSAPRIPIVAPPKKRPPAAGRRG